MHNILRKYAGSLFLFATIFLLVFQYIWSTELWDFQRLYSRYAQYIRGGMYDGASPHMSPNQSKIIFSSPTTGRGDIYTINVDNEQRQRLASTNNYEGEPIYSPDGKKIAYLREDAKAVLHVWIMNSDGTNQKQLTNSLSDDVWPVFAPDGYSIVFTRIDVTSDKYYLYSVTISEAKVVRLSPAIREEEHATFNSTGEWRLCISYGPPEGLWITRKNGKSFRVGEGCLDPCISADGTKIAYIINEEPRQLCIMNRDGSSIRTAYSTEDYIASCSFTPDGKRILLLQTASGRHLGQIVLVDIQTGTVVASYEIG